MKALISSSACKRLITGSKNIPLTVVIQNISANNVYVSLDWIDAVTGNGLKITSGGTYTHENLKGALYVLADVDASEIRYEAQEA